MSLVNPAVGSGPTPGTEPNRAESEDEIPLSKLTFTGDNDLSFPHLCTGLPCRFTALQSHSAAQLQTGEVTSTELPFEKFPCLFTVMQLRFLWKNGHLLESTHAS